MAKNNDFVMGTNSTDDRSRGYRNAPVDSRVQTIERSSIIERARARPVVAAAAVTAVAAAGAYLWSKRSASSQPLMRWGQEGSQSSGYDSATAASDFDKQAQSSFDSAYAPEVEIASATPSSSAGIGAGGMGSGSADDLKSSIDKGVSTLGGGSAAGSTIDTDLGSLGAKVGAGGTNIDGPSSNVGSQISDKGETGLDDVSKTDTKTGSIAYGA